MILLNAQTGDSGLTTLIFFGLIFFIMYFFMIRPQVKKQKKENAFRDALKKGQKIITIGGIHGKILEISQNTLVIGLIDGNKLKIEKSSVSMTGISQQMQEK
tara:strand:- start:506 stop:811 length:306 start_codon:yes stop_codon:yes gene_type:complete